MTRGCLEVDATSKLDSSTDVSVRGLEQLSPESNGDERLGLGLTLQGLREVLRGWGRPSDAIERVNRENHEFPPNSCLNGYVNQFCCTQEELKDGLSMCQRLQKQGSPHVGKANIFVSWALSASLFDVADALEEFLQDSESPMDSVFFWICDLTIHQTDVQSDLRRLEQSIKNIGHTVLFLEPWHDPEPLRRAYCVKEIFCTQKHRAQFSLIMTRTQKSKFEKALVENFEVIRQSLSRVNVREADCRSQEDKIAILSEVQRDVGFAKCNQQVISALSNALVAQGVAALDSLSGNEQKTSELLLNVGFLQFCLGHGDAAEKLLRDAYNWRCEVLGKGHEKSLAAMVCLAQVLLSKGDLHAAEPLLCEMLELCCEEQGDRHPSTLTAMTRLSDVFLREGKSSEAELLLRKVVELSCEMRGKRDPNTVVAMSFLADVLLSKGDFLEAEPLLREVVELECEVHGERHPITLDGMRCLGSLLCRKSDFNEAEPLLREVLELSREVNGEQHPNTLAVMGSLGQLLFRKGDLREAELLLREEVELRRERYGERNQHILDTMHSLGQLLGSKAVLHDDKAILHEAERLLREVVQLEREVHGERHPKTLAAMRSLSNVLVDKKDFGEAELLLREVLELSREVNAERHSKNTLMTMLSLGGMLEHKSDLCEIDLCEGDPVEVLHAAELLFREMMELSRDVLGEYDITTQVASDHLVRCDAKRQRQQRRRQPR